MAGIKIRMHEYAPNEGHVLMQYRMKLSTGVHFTFRAGGTYEVPEEDARWLLATRSRPDSTRETIPLAFVRVADNAPVEAPGRKPMGGDMTTADLPKPEPPPLPPAPEPEPEFEPAPRPKPARKPRTRKPKDE